MAGWFIDRKSPKRYAYPSIISVDVQDTVVPYYDYNRFNPAKQLMKITPLKVFAIHNSSLELAYERTTGEDFSTQLMVSYLLPTSIYQISSDFKENTKGYRIALEERFYFKKRVPFGTYIGLELDYLKKRAFHQNYFYTALSEDAYQDTYMVHSQYLSTNLKLGHQKEYRKVFIDFYIGVGRRNRKVHHTQRENLGDKLQSNSHFNFNHIEEGRHSSISIPLNFRLGWRF